MVIVRAKNGYEAVLRFSDPKLDLIITSRYADKLMEKVYAKVRAW
jgi:hypothetical protein